MDNIFKTIAIDPERYHVISVVGAGGKTTMIYALAESYRKIGKKVIVTTTTHMKIPAGYVVLTEDAAIRKMMVESAVYNQVVTVGIPDSEENGVHKMRGPGAEELKELRKLCDILLVEADGSKCLPVKAPESFEPVIPDMTQLVIGIAGGSAVGRKIKDVSFRIDQVCKILQKTPEDLMTAEDLVTLLMHDKGQRKMVFCDYRAVINQADCLSDSEKQYVERLGILHTSFPVFQRM